MTDPINIIQKSAPRQRERGTIGVTDDKEMIRGFPGSRAGKGGEGSGRRRLSAGKIISIKLGEDGLKEKKLKG